MNKDQFIKKWRNEVGGLAMFGSFMHMETPTQRTKRMFEIPGEVDRLLADIFDSLQPAKPAVNGKLPTESGRPF